jgi:hypothetical protein
MKTASTQRAVRRGSLRPQFDFWLVMLLILGCAVVAVLTLALWGGH